MVKWKPDSGTETGVEPFYGKELFYDASSSLYSS